MTLGENLTFYSDEITMYDLSWFGIWQKQLKLRSSRAESNWQLRPTVDQKSSSVQMASAYHVGTAVLAHVARSGQLESALDERN